MKRKELGLYQNEVTFFSELQLLLDEMLNLFEYADRKTNIMSTLQNISGCYLTKEARPRIVAKCHNCSSFIPFTNTCAKCKNAFYCDQSCVRAHSLAHAEKCVDLLSLTPRIKEQLIVEVHSGTDMGMDVKMYYEHERRFSFKIRGMQIFQQLFQFFQAHKWFKGNNYETEFDLATKQEISFKYVRKENGSNSPRSPSRPMQASIYSDSGFYEDQSPS